MGGTCSMYGEMININRIIIEKLTKRPLERHLRRWESNIKTNLTEIHCGT
jgi:hypothetical protein